MVVWYLCLSYYCIRDESAFRDCGVLNVFGTGRGWVKSIIVGLWFCTSNRFCVLGGFCGSTP